jgi:ABC-type Fe3+/spermidine/putrescine transport system ATPase subunit
MVEIVLEGVTKRFGGQVAVDALDARFASGGVTCLLGPSGCGKTTLMRMIAGLEMPTAGRVLIGGATSRACRQAHATLAWCSSTP